MNHNNDINKKTIQNQYNQPKISNYLEHHLQNKEFLSYFDKQFSFYDRLLTSKARKYKSYKKTIGEDFSMQKIFNTNSNQKNIQMKYSIKLNNVKNPCEKRITDGDDIKNLNELNSPFLKSNKQKLNVNFEYTARTSTPRKEKFRERNKFFEDIFFTKPNDDKNLANDINQDQNYIVPTSEIPFNIQNTQNSTESKNSNYLNQSNNKDNNQFIEKQKKNNILPKQTCKSAYLNNKNLRRYIIEQSKIPSCPTTVEFSIDLKSSEKNWNLSNNFTKKCNFNDSEWSVRDKISFFDKLGKIDQNSNRREIFTAPEMGMKNCSSFFNEINDCYFKSFYIKTGFRNNKETNRDFSIKTKIAAFELLCKQN